MNAIAEFLSFVLIQGIVEHLGAVGVLFDLLF